MTEEQRRVYGKAPGSYPNREALEPKPSKFPFGLSVLRSGITITRGGANDHGDRCVQRLPPKELNPSDSYLLIRRDSSIQTKSQHA